MARYPNINIEGTTFKFMIKCMRGVDEYKQLSRDWISIPPTNLRSLKAGAIIHSAFEAYYSTTHPIPFTQYSAPQRTPTPTTVQMMKTFSYHASLGAGHNHDDHTCRDPKNSKFPNFQPPTPTASTTPTFKTFRGSRSPIANNSGQDSDTESMSGVYDSFYDQLGQMEQHDDVNSILMLDSAAHPTNYPKAKPLMHKLPMHYHTTTATNSQSSLTHKGPLCLNTPHGTIFVPPVVAPVIPDTLVSIRSLAGPREIIVFDQNHSYTIPKQFFNKQITFNHISICRINSYVLDSVHTQQQPHQSLRHPSHCKSANQNFPNIPTSPVSSAHPQARPWTHPHHTPTFNSIHPQSRTPQKSPNNP